MKFYCELRAGLVSEDAINFRFFFSRTLLHKPQARGRRRSINSWHVHRIRKSHIYIQTDFCVTKFNQKEKQRQKQRRFSSCETPSTSGCGPQSGRDKANPCHHPSPPAQAPWCYTFFHPFLVTSRRTSYLPLFCNAWSSPSSPLLLPFFISLSTKSLSLLHTPSSGVWLLLFCRFVLVIVCSLCSPAKSCATEGIVHL